MEVWNIGGMCTGGYDLKEDLIPEVEGSACAFTQKKYLL